MDDMPRTCWIDPARKCPKCGSPLNSNGRHLWCGFRADRAALICDYGIAEVVTVEQHGEAR